jgi:hypothetical protein
VTIAEQVDIRDAHSGQVLGQLVNLSADGLMLVGPRRHPPGTVFQLRIPLESGASASDLVLGAEALWCQDANDTGAYWSGFQIIDISPEHQELLNAFIRD